MEERVTSSRTPDLSRLREGRDADPRRVLLSVERLVLAAGESVRRLRQVQSVSQDIGDDWTDGRALGEMAAQLDEVRCRLLRLRDEARQAAGEAADDRQAI